MDLELEGRRAMVTGGSRGIGKAIARVLAAEGCDVVVAARGRDDLEATAAELHEETGRRIVALVMDSGDDESVAAAVQAATEKLGGIDILVNNAAVPMGQATPPKLADITTDAFWADVNVKVMGYIRTAQAVAPQMVERGWGRIVNVSGRGARSTGSVVGSARNVSVAAITKNLADELGPHGVNVTVVHPGLTRTERTDDVVAAVAERSGQTPEEVEASLASRSTVQRLVDAEEVAWVVAFLASPKASSITGDAIACGGGQPGAIHY